MKRNILAVLLCAAMLLLVSSCGGEQNSDGNDKNGWNLRRTFFRGRVQRVLHGAGESGQGGQYPGFS